MKHLWIIVVALCSQSVVAENHPPVIVKSVTEMGTGQAIEVNGVIRSRHDVELPALVEGELLWVLEEGVLVDEGEVVAKVDDRQLVLQREEQALLLARAEINLEYLDGEVARLKALQATNMAPRNQLAEMISRRDLASNDVNVARNRIARLDDDIERTQLRAPVASVVAERLKDGGEFARRGESVVRVVDPDALEVLVTVPVAYAARIHPDSRLQVQVETVRFEAPVRQIVRSGNRVSQTFSVLVDVPVDAARQVLAGQLAEVELALSDEGRALFVPRDAVVLRGSGTWVYRINSDNVAQRIDVTLGKGQGELVSVLGDLHAGDRVAVRGVERLADGQAVQPENS